MLVLIINTVHRHYQDLYMEVERPTLLRVAVLMYYEDYIKQHRHRIWDRSYWKLGANESICAIAAALEGQLKRIDKYKEALANGMTIWKEIAQDNS